MFGKSKSKFIVLVSDGVEGFPCPAEHVWGYNEGICIDYVNQTGVINRVYCPHGYRPLKVGDMYWVGKTLGNNSACGICDVQIEGKTEKVAVASDVVGLPADPACPGDDLSALVGSDILGTCVRSLYSTTKIPWKIIIIVGCVAAIGFLLYKSGILAKLGIGS